MRHTADPNAGLTPLDAFRPRPGQFVVALSAGCAGLASHGASTRWPELANGLAHAAIGAAEDCWLALPEQLDDQAALAVCRAAHEVWVLEDELETSATARTLHALRTQSAPPSMGERRSVLNAPEVGRVRVWRTGGPFVLELHGPSTHGADAGSLRRHLSAVARRVAGQASDTPQDWEAMADVLQGHAARRQRLVRGSLALLFALTTLGVLALQLLSMSSWGIPMADLYAVFFLAVGGLYLWGKKLHWNTEQLAWCALAEALQCQAVLARAGIRHAPVTALYSLRHRQQVDWIREALRPMGWALHRCPAAPAPDVRHILQAWVPDAIARHRRLGQAQVAKSKALAWGMQACYAAGGLLTVLALGDWIQSPGIGMALSTSIGLTSSLGTLLLIFNGVLGFGEDAALHHQLEAVFLQAKEFLSLPMTSHEDAELLLDLAQECVQQSAERVLL